MKIASVRLRREVSDEQHPIGATFLDKRDKLHESSKESTKREEDFVSLTEDLKEKSKADNRTMAQVGRGVFEDHRSIVGKEETEEVLFRVLADGGRGRVGARRDEKLGGCN